MTLMVALLMAVLPSAASGIDDTAERKKLEGTWELESLKIAGESRFDPAMEITWEFAGTKLTARGKMGLDGQRAATGEVRIKPEEDPKWIDLELSGGQSYMGIYQIKGPRLLVCYRPKDRPQRFASEPGSRTVLMEFRKKDGRTD